MFTFTGVPLWVVPRSATLEVEWLWSSIVTFRRSEAFSIASFILDLFLSFSLFPKMMVILSLGMISSTRFLTSSLKQVCLAKSNQKSVPG